MAWKPFDPYTYENVAGFIASKSEGMGGELTQSLSLSKVLSVPLSQVGWQGAKGRIPVLLMDQWRSRLIRRQYLSVRFGCVNSCFAWKTGSCYQSVEGVLIVRRIGCIVDTVFFYLK